MGLLDKLKGKGWGKDAEPVGGFDELQADAESEEPQPDTVSGVQGHVTLDMNALPTVGDSSIISEATPSELAPDFAESRLHAGALAAGAAGAVALPPIGNRSPAEQQRILIITI